MIIILEEWSDFVLVSCLLYSPAALQSRIKSKIQKRSSSQATELFRLQKSFIESALNLRFVILHSLKQRGSLMRRAQNNAIPNLALAADLHEDPRYPIRHIQRSASVNQHVRVYRRTNWSYFPLWKERRETADGLEYFYSRSPGGPFRAAALDVVSLKVDKGSSIPRKREESINPSLGQYYVPYEGIVIATTETHSSGEN